MAFTPNKPSVEQDANPAETQDISDYKALIFSWDAETGLCVGVCKTPHVTDCKSVLQVEQDANPAATIKREI